jgi:hypothetical protein
MGNPRAYHVWFKVGDIFPDDKDLKDGEPCFYQPANGLDKYGRPYYIGPGDRKGYAIAWVMATEEEIEELFKAPHKNSTAYKKGRRTNYFISYEDTFTAEYLAEYRDHDKEVEPFDMLSLAGLSDYRVYKERLDKPYVHGSITTGDYTIGSGGDYATLTTFRNDIAANIGSGVLRGTVLNSHESGNSDIDFNQTSASDGSITVDSSSTYGGWDAPIVSTTSTVNQIIARGNANVTIEKLRTKDFQLFSLSASVSTRETIIRNIIVDASSFNGAITASWTGASSTKKLKIYNCICRIVGPPSTYATGLYVAVASNTDVDTDYWNSNVFIENITIICNTPTTDLKCFRGNLGVADATYTFKNIAGYVESGTGEFADYSGSSNTIWKFVNCARNADNNIANKSEVDCITTLAATDFESINIASEDFVKIDKDSVLFKAGIAGLVENTHDIMGTEWTSPPSIGAYSILPKRDPIASLELIDNTTLHTTLEIELAEHVTGLASYSGNAYSKAYFKDEFNCFNGDDITIHKKITRLEVEGIALTKESSAANVVSNNGTWWQDIPNETLYVHFTESDAPSQHTVVAFFNYYISEEGVVLTADGDTRLFEPRLDTSSLPSITQSFNEPLVGTVNVSGGGFTLLNGNGLYDQLLDKYIWLNCLVTIKRGYDDLTYANYSNLGVMTITGWKLDPQRVRFSVKNKFNALFEDIPPQTYTTDDSDTFGGITYGSTYPDKLIGKPKPLAWGLFDERQAPVLNMIREDTNFVSFGLYTTTSKTDSDMSPTAPAYNPGVTFTATNIVLDDNGFVESFRITQSTDYMNRESGFWDGYYITTTDASEKAKISSYDYDPESDIATMRLVESYTERITGSVWSTFKIYCPVYHYMVANHNIKSIDNVYVDKGGEEGKNEWIYLEDETELVNSSWYRLVVPIPGFSTSTKTRAAFTSKDTALGGNPAVDTLENHADIVEDILINPNILATPFVAADLDSISFTDSAADRNYPLAIYLNEPIKAIDVLKIIRQSVIAKLMFTLDGKIKYVTWNPSDPTASTIKELTEIEMLGDVIFEALLRDIFYGFIVRYGQDGESGEYLEERYVYEPTRYLYRVTKTRVIDTYLRSSSKAQRTAQRFTYFNRNVITKLSLRLPNNMLRTGSTEDSIHTPGEYVKITSERGPGPESASGDEFGQYRKTYEILKVQDSVNGIGLAGDNIKGLAINSGYWTDDAAISIGILQHGFWCNDAGEAVPGDDSTKNTSLWV